MTTIHQSLLGRVMRLPTDYRDYGDTVERWRDPALAYADCSGGYRHFAALEAKLGSDWGVCTKLGSPRFSLLTFEHQAGAGYSEQGKKPDFDGLFNDKDFGS